MIKEAIEKIEEMKSARILSANGRAYSTEELHELPGPSPMANAVDLHTLSGLVDYIGRGFDGVKDAAVFIGGPVKVSLANPLHPTWRQRECFANVTPFLSDGFPFGRYLDSESFVVRLQSAFIQDETTATILRIVGNLQSQAVQTVVDDGVSQQVTAKCGVARVENVVVPNPVMLRPFRTFQEIEQPESRFILRLKRDGDGLPAAALFESDDCQWKVAAINRIREYLAAHLKDTPVFA